VGGPFGFGQRFSKRNHRQEAKDIIHQSLVNWSFANARALVPNAAKCKGDATQFRKMGLLGRHGYFSRVRGVK